MRHGLKVGSSPEPRTPVTSKTPETLGPSGPLGAVSLLQLQFHFKDFYVKFTSNDCFDKVWWKSGNHTKYFWYSQDPWPVATAMTSGRSGIIYQLFIISTAVAIGVSRKRCCKTRSKLNFSRFMWSRLTINIHDVFFPETTSYWNSSQDLSLTYQILRKPKLFKKRSNFSELFYFYVQAVFSFRVHIFHFES